MNNFRFSQRSLSNLVDIEDALVEASHRALAVTKVDFGVICGRRTLQEQMEMVESGASTTMDSRHLTGHAVDVMAYIGSQGRWELPLYCHIVLAYKKAAAEMNTELRWGGCWELLSRLPSTPELILRRVEDWAAARRAVGRRAFIDAGHIEIPRGY